MFFANNLASNTRFTAPLNQSGSAGPELRTLWQYLMPGWRASSQSLLTLPSLFNPLCPLKTTNNNTLYFRPYLSAFMVSSTLGLEMTKENLWQYF